jgi:cytochrome c oxidase assembly protein subunit 15
MLGIVFVVGFIYFLAFNYFDKRMIKPFIILFLLGAMQGLIGWIMVASGLNDEHLYVDHIKLALHFISAMILACYTLWFALKLLIPEQRIIDNRLFLSSFYTYHCCVRAAYLWCVYGRAESRTGCAYVAKY